MLFKVDISKITKKIFIEICDFLKMKTSPRPNLPIFSHWTSKNILDLQQFVQFLKSHNVVNHSTLLTMTMTYRQLQSDVVYKNQSFSRGGKEDQSLYDKVRVNKIYSWGQLKGQCHEIFDSFRGDQKFLLAKWTGNGDTMSALSLTTRTRTEKLLTLQTPCQQIQRLRGHRVLSLSSQRLC